ncbi:MAG: thymidylate kinase [Bacteroidales bacterium]
MLIVLEGLDGAGKSTQIKLLGEYFKGEGKEVKYLHFPRYKESLYGDLIARFLRGEFGSKESVHPMLVALLFGEDRRVASHIIKEWLERGSVVILDRYLYSNIAFQCAKIEDSREREELREWIINFEYNQNQIPKATTTLFLDLPISVVAGRLNNLRDGEERSYLKGKRDIHEADIAYQERVRELYLNECQRGSHMIKIDCLSQGGETLPPKEISKKIIDKIGE